MKSDDLYGQARDLLKKHFGDPFKVANAYIVRLTKWPSVKAKDGQVFTRICYCIGTS